MLRTRLFIQKLPANTDLSLMHYFHHLLQSSTQSCVNVCLHDKPNSIEPIAPLIGQSGAGVALQ